MVLFKVLAIAVSLSLSSENLGSVYVFGENHEWQGIRNKAKKLAFDGKMYTFIEECGHPTTTFLHSPENDIDKIVEFHEIIVALQFWKDGKPDAARLVLQDLDSFDGRLDMFFFRKEIVQRREQLGNEFVGRVRNFCLKYYSKLDQFLTLLKGEELDLEVVKSFSDWLTDRRSEMFVEAMIPFVHKDLKNVVIVGYEHHDYVFGLLNEKLGNEFVVRSLGKANEAKEIDSNWGFLQSFGEEIKMEQKAELVKDGFAFLKQPLQGMPNLGKGEVGKIVNVEMERVGILFPSQKKAYSIKLENLTAVMNQAI